MRRKKMAFVISCALLILAFKVSAAEEKTWYQTGELEPIEPAKSFLNTGLLIGGGGNVDFAVADVVDWGYGASAKVRASLAPHISLETSLDYIRFRAHGVNEEFFRSFEAEDDEEASNEELKFNDIEVHVDGNVDSLILFPALLIHFDGPQNVRFYFMGGAGYQFNRADAFNAKVTALAEEDSNEEDDIQERQQLIVMDVDVDDGLVFGAGIGVDVLVSPRFIVNVDMRYQFSTFEVTQTGTFQGQSLTLTDDENLQAILLRATLLYRF